MSVNKKRLDELVRELVEQVGKDNPLLVAMTVDDSIACFANEADLKKYVQMLTNFVLAEEGENRKFFFAMFLYSLLDAMQEDKELFKEFMEGFTRFAENNGCANIIVSHESKPTKTGKKDLTIN